MAKTRLYFVFVSLLLLFALVRVVFFQPQALPLKSSVAFQAKIIQTPEYDGPNLKLHVQPYQNNQALKELLVYTKRYPEFQAHDILEIEGKTNQYGNIYFPKIKKIRSDSNPIQTVLEKFKKVFQNSVHRSIPEPHAALVLGMLIGVQGDMPEKTEDALRKTGTIHMLVVSGFNIMLVASFGLKLAGILHRKYAIIIALCITWLFIALTGAQPPALRAGVMASCLLIAQFVGRPSKTIAIFIITIFILLLISPELFYSLSFQLSCAATAGIIILPPYISHKVSKIGRWVLNVLHIKTPDGSKRDSFKKYLKEEAGVTLSAQLAVLPLILNSFGSLSVISPVTNLLVSWTIPYIMLVGLSVGLAGMVSELIGQVISFVLMPFTAYFLNVLYVTSTVPYSYFENITINIPLIVGIYILLIILITKRTENKNYSKQQDLKII